MVAKYELELRLDGVLVGNIRKIAQNLVWTRQRARVGVDSITFSLNDKLFADWCEEHRTSINELLRPLALDCRVIRNGVPVVGGFLATMPAYSPRGSTATLAMKFDGYLNYLANVYLEPGYSQKNVAMGDVVKSWLDVAEERAVSAGKGFGFKAGEISEMAKVTSSFNNYKDIKGAIVDRCDNESGAGPFDFFVHPDRTYDVIKDSDFGDTITDYAIQYPVLYNVPSATSISASELTGFASCVIGIGAGTVSPDSTTQADEPAEDNQEAIIAIKSDSEAVKKYGYAEVTLQNSSVSVLETLEANVESELSSRTAMQWQPQIKMSGNHVNPVPKGSRKIWIGDTVTLQNNADRTGMTSGKFRVNSLSVSVAATGAEEITPTLSRGDAVNTNSFANDFVRMQSELLALKTAK